MAASSKISFGIAAIGLPVALVLAGCAARANSAAAKPATAKPAAANSAAAKPAPLSTPQTQVELPKAQPIDPAALDTVPPPVVETPAPPRPTPPTPRKNPPRPDPVAPPTPVTTPPENTREPVQEVVSAADLKRFQESAQSRKREVARILDSIKNRRLSKAQQNDVASIRSFVALSDESEKRNEMRQADVLAERAQILARGLPNGK